MCLQGGTTAIHKISNKKIEHFFYSIIVICLGYVSHVVNYNVHVGPEL